MGTSLTGCICVQGEKHELVNDSPIKEYSSAECLRETLWDLRQEQTDAIDYYRHYR